MRPDVGSSIRLIMRSEVVLPHPDGPTKTVILPVGASSDEIVDGDVSSPKRLVTDSNRITGPPREWCCVPDPAPSWAPMTVASSATIRP